MVQEDERFPRRMIWVKIGGCHSSWFRDVKFTIEHPDHPGVIAEYGFDPALGFFITVRGLGEPREYDALRAHYSHLQGALDYMLNFGFFSQGDLEEALTRMQHELPDEMPARLRRIAEVVLNFKAAADQ